MRETTNDPTIELAELIDRIDAAVAGGALAVASTDLDHFRELNEQHGRATGDRILSVWVETLIASLPSDAIVGRLGGDEFGIGLPNTSAENAVILLDEIRSHLADHPVDGHAISATFGVAARPPHATETDELFRCAESALARGKREGGGRVAIYVEEKMVLKSNYYPRGTLHRLSKLAEQHHRTEASLLREALDDLIRKLR